VRLACTCPASRFRADCKHRAALRLGDLSAVVGLTPDIERVLAALLTPRMRGAA
jgi:DNA polymerase-3 subunit epsilon